MARDRVPPVQNGIRGSAFLRGCRYILIFRGLRRHVSTSYNTVLSNKPKRRVSVLSVWTRMGLNLVFGVWRVVCVLELVANRVPCVRVYHNPRLYTRTTQVHSYYIWNRLNFNRIGQRGF